MKDTKEIDILIGQLRETIQRRASGTLSPEKTDHVYRTLLARFNALEKRHHSDRPGGYIKGVLHHHNRHNHSSLTAILVKKEDAAIPVVFAGDAILLQAIPEIIEREAQSISAGNSVRIPLGDKSGHTHVMSLKKFEPGDETIFVASVTSTPLFDLSAFDYIADFACSVYDRYSTYFDPTTLDYIQRLSSELVAVYESSMGVLYADHFILKNPLSSLSLTGTRTLIDFSEYIVQTLSDAYPEPVVVLVVSLGDYLVLFDDGATSNADVRHNRIDIVYNTNLVPYRSTRTAIDSPGALAVFIEEL